MIAAIKTRILILMFSVLMLVIGMFSPDLAAKVFFYALEPRKN